MDIWWREELPNISGISLRMIQERIKDSLFFQEAHSHHQDNTLLIGQVTTTVTMLTWTTLSQVLWTLTCSVSLMLDQMFAVSSEMRLMMFSVPNGHNLPLSILLQDSTTIFTRLQMSLILWRSPINLLWRELCTIDISTWDCSTHVSGRWVLLAVHALILNSIISLLKKQTISKLNILLFLQELLKLPLASQILRVALLLHTSLMPLVNGLI